MAAVQVFEAEPVQAVHVPSVILATEFMIAAHEGATTVNVPEESTVPLAQATEQDWKPVKAAVVVSPATVDAESSPTVQPNVFHAD